MPKKISKKTEKDCNIIIELIHQRSIAFDEARAYREMLEIAELAMETTFSLIKGLSHNRDRYLIGALENIKTKKKELMKR